MRKNGSNNRGNVIPFINNWGIAETFFAEDGKVKFGATDPRMKDALEWLNRCYAEGLLDQEYLTRDKTAWYSAWTNNQVFMSYDWSAYIDNVSNLFKDVETDINIVGAVPPEGPTGISETRDQPQPITGRRLERRYLCGRDGRTEEGRPEAAGLCLQRRRHDPDELR